MRLIITEKNDAASKIAGILAKGKPKQDAFYKVPYYALHRRTGCRERGRGPEGARAAGGVPARVRRLAKGGPVCAHRRAADQGRDGQVRGAGGQEAGSRRHDSVVIATDYDREGELIGLEALEIATDANEHLVRTVRRARFSSLTPRDIHHAFANLDHLSEPLAMGG